MVEAGFPSIASLIPQVGTQQDVVDSVEYPYASAKAFLAN